MLRAGTARRAAATSALVGVLLTGCTTGSPTGERASDGLREQRAELPGAALQRAEARRDTGPPPVALDRVPAGAREDVPSALRSPGAAGLPAPLVDPAELTDGGQPPDGIPALDDPRFQRTPDVRWVDDAEQVLVVEVGGEARAYPVQVLALHEIVNDTVGGVPVAVTFCPLCASGVAFDRRVGDRVLSFGTSGRLYRSDLVMYDRQTESLWPQIAGHAVAGVLTGTELEVLPASLVSWAQWREAHPDGWVLGRPESSGLPYGTNPYYRYDDPASLPLFLDGPVDGRLPWFKSPVVGIAAGDDALAVDVEALRTDGVREVEVDGRPLTVWWLPGARSSLDDLAVGEGREVGTTAVLDPVLDGRRLSFDARDGAVVDRETGSTWDAFGTAVAGPLAGARLTPVPHTRTLWFAWRAFHTATRVVR